MNPCIIRVGGGFHSHRGNLPQKKANAFCNECCNARAEPTGGTVIVIVSGTDRTAARTTGVARMVEQAVAARGETTVFLNLQTLPAGIFQAAHYGRPPAEFAPFQKAILEASGIITVVPEYNGSFPGALKYFLDLLKFPESLRGMPSAFVGVSSGRFGAVRAVEQLEMIFQYREAHIFARRCFFPAVEKLVVDGAIQDEFIAGFFESMIQDFCSFVRKVRLP
ncbi:MAG: NAD(P)H-dependent oxidoreductase [Spirochaetales bacterium]|nr:NAD(P)H-dependent oxidoreductase [Spirochaetales bacterium]